MSRSIVWPRIAPPEEIEPEAPLHGFDVPGLAAAFGPELARRMGFRITTLPDPLAPLSASTVLLGRIPLPRGSGPKALAVGAPPESAAMLLERLFGARPADAIAARGADLFALPPGSASWVALCRTVSTALVAALASAGHPVGGSPALPMRALALPHGPYLGLAVDADGAPCRLLLAPELPEAAPPVPAPDPARFREAARSRTLDLELPVALRIAERRVSLEQTSRMKAGDILPIDPVQSIDLLAAGQRIARLPASAFTPTPTNEEDPQ